MIIFLHILRVNGLLFPPSHTPAYDCPLLCFKKKGYGCEERNETNYILHLSKVGDLLFRCPCYAEDEATLLNPGDPRRSRPQGRIYYGVCCIIWPAVASFFLGTHFSFLQFIR